MAIDFLELLKKLAACDVEFVIVGGVAARAHGSRRLTHDVDIVPQLEPTGWAALIVEELEEILRRQTKPTER
ncbi:MAG: hypothetical protein R3B13_16960 [Polyangiaceae bacterium]